MACAGSMVLSGYDNGWLLHPGDDGKVRLGESRRTLALVQRYTNRRGMRRGGGREGQASGQLLPGISLPHASGELLL